MININFASNNYIRCKYQKLTNELFWHKSKYRNLDICAAVIFDFV